VAAPPAPPAPPVAVLVGLAVWVAFRVGLALMTGLAVWRWSLVWSALLVALPPVALLSPPVSVIGPLVLVAVWSPLRKVGLAVKVLPPLLPPWAERTGLTLMVGLADEVEVPPAPPVPP
jgi:hypothetical protein